MLGKLMKYEFKSTARLFLPLYLALVVMAVIQRVFSLFDDDLTGLMRVPKGLSTFLFVILVLAVIFLTLIIIIQRYYKNLLTDEGYLMFTLPVRPHSLILSKLIVSFVWTLASTVAILLSLLVVFWTPDLFAMLSYYYEAISIQLWYSLGIDLDLLVFSFVFLLATGVVHSILMIYASISIGQTFVGHKVAGAFCAYLVINVALQIISSVITLPMAFFTDMFNENYMYLHPNAVCYYLLGYGVLSIAFSVVFFFLSNYMLTRRLNLD